MGNSALEYDIGPKGDAGSAGAPSTVTGPAGPSVTGPTGPSITGPTGPSVTGPTGAGSTGPTGPSVTGPTGASGAVGTGDLYYWRHVGTTNYESWYTLPATTTGLGSLVTTANRIYWVPFPCPKSITLDYIGIYVATGHAASTAHLGIFNDSGQCPSTVVVDTGDISTASSTTAIKAAISAALTAGNLYWLAIQCSYGITIESYALTYQLNMMGIKNDLKTPWGNLLYYDTAYAAFATFSGTPTIDGTTTAPAIMVRLSA